MLKKIFRMFAIMLVVSLITGVGSLGFLLYKVFSPSLEESGLTYKDLLKTELSKDEYDRLQASLNKKSGELGSKSAKSLMDGINKLLPSKDFDYSKVPAAPYNGPSVDDVLKESQEKAQQGVNQGLQMLDKSIEKNSKSK